MSRAFAAAEGVSEILIHTGQHFDPDMSQIFFEELGLATPRVNLHIHGGGHGEMTGRMLAALERIINQERPNLVLVASADGTVWITFNGEIYNFMEIRREL